MAAATDPGDDGGIREGPVPEMASTARESAEALVDADSVLVVTHNDADGISSAAIATRALERAGIDHELSISEQLNEERIDRIAGYAAGDHDDLDVQRAVGSPGEDHDAVLFADFGSGQQETIAAAAEGTFTPVIADHHSPSHEGEGAGEDVVDHHLNPLFEGVDGASELSGAGTTYVLARQLAGLDGTNADRDSSLYGPQRTNKDLAKQAVIGAVADQQGGPMGLNGANRGLLREGEEAGVLECVQDLNAYGKQTRSIPKMLSYVDSRSIPGVAGDATAAKRLLSVVDGDRSDVGASDPSFLRYLAADPDAVDDRDDLSEAETRLVDFDDEFDLREDGEWRRWVDLDPDERERLAGLIETVATANGADADRVDELVGENYLLAGELDGTTARDPDELATDLNSAGRYDQPKDGLAVALGDRNPYGPWGNIKELREERKRILGKGINMVERAFENAHEEHWSDGERASTAARSVDDLDDVFYDYRDDVIGAIKTLENAVEAERGWDVATDELFQRHREEFAKKIGGVEGAVRDTYGLDEGEEEGEEGDEAEETDDRLVDSLDVDDEDVEAEFDTHRDFVADMVSEFEEELGVDDDIAEAVTTYKQSVLDAIERTERRATEFDPGPAETPDRTGPIRVGGVTVDRRENLSWFEISGAAERNHIPSQEVGVIAGIVRGNLRDSEVGLEGPIVGFAPKNEEGEESELKVSTRGDGRLVDEGLDLSTVVGEAAEAVDGEGGGHDVAAGASIPKDGREEFVERLDELVGAQLGRDGEDRGVER